MKNIFGLGFLRSRTNILLPNGTEGNFPARAFIGGNHYLLLDFISLRWNVNEVLEAIWI